MMPPWTLVVKPETRNPVKLDRRYALSNVRGGRGAARRTIGLLGAVMTYAIKQGLRTDNLVHGVLRPADKRRERRLRDEEYTALGEALHVAEDADDWAPALAAIRFLVITGWRRGEALTLRWSEVDVTKRTAHLASTKTGSSTRALSERACTILRTMPWGRVRVPGSGRRPAHNRLCAGLAACGASSGRAAQERDPARALPQLRQPNRKRCKTIEPSQKWATFIHGGSVVPVRN